MQAQHALLMSSIILFSYSVLLFFCVFNRIFQGSDSLPAWHEYLSSIFNLTFY